MPKLKYFQSIADLKNYLSDAEFDVAMSERSPDKIRGILNDGFKQKYGVGMDELLVLQDELEAVRYLLSVQSGVHNYHVNSLVKPANHLILSALDRYKGYLDWLDVEQGMGKQFKGEQLAYYKKERTKKYAMIELYTERFSGETVWVTNLPDEVKSIQQK